MGPSCPLRPTQSSRDAVWIESLSESRKRAPLAIGCGRGNSGTAGTPPQRCGCIRSASKTYPWGTRPSVMENPPPQVLWLGGEESGPTCLIRRRGAGATACRCGLGGDPNTTRPRSPGSRKQTKSPEPRPPLERREAAPGHAEKRKPKRLRKLLTGRVAAALG